VGRWATIGPVLFNPANYEASRFPISLHMEETTSFSLKSAGPGTRLSEVSGLFQRLAPAVLLKIFAGLVYRLCPAFPRL
jgi:hypothetical protein